jgi:phosphoribosyl-dephospho-CoA transferase
MDHKRLDVHDLVWISDDAQLYSLPHPDWACDALRRSPVVVVRRAQAPPDFVAVGVRGTGREQRHGTMLCRADVQACRTPESLAAERGWSNGETQISVPICDALTIVREYSLKEGLVWGPIGSVGYQLATKASVTNLSSDLDVMIRCHAPPDRNQMRMFDEHLRKAPVRVDVVLEGPCGGVAMREYLNGDEVLIKDSRGARIGIFV